MLLWWCTLYMYSAWAMQDFICLICYRYCAKALAYTVMYVFRFYFYQCILAVIFFVLCIPERLQLFDSSTTADVKVLTKESNRDQHHSRTRKPPASGKLRSTRTLDSTSRRKERTLEQILIICFIMFRHQFELVWFAHKELTAWAIPLPIRGLNDNS